MFFTNLFWMLLLAGTNYVYSFTDPTVKPSPHISPANLQPPASQPDMRLNLPVAGQQSAFPTPSTMGNSLFGGLSAFSSNPNVARLGSMPGPNSMFGPPRPSPSGMQSPNRLVAGPGPQLSIPPARSLFDTTSAAFMPSSPTARQIGDMSSLAVLHQQAMLQNTAKQLDHMLQARLGMAALPNTIPQSSQRAEMSAMMNQPDFTSFSRGLPMGRHDGMNTAFSASQYRPALAPFPLDSVPSQYRRPNDNALSPSAGASFPESRFMLPPSLTAAAERFPLGYDPSEKQAGLPYSSYLKPSKAVVIINGPYGVSGLLNLTQNAPDLPVEIMGRISGVRPGEHGFHVHSLGDLSSGCESAGSHFNPEGNYHGSPDDVHSHMQPHAGDLGNVRANEYGDALVSVMSPLISLYQSSASFVIGRTLVIHEKPDDLGRGNGESRENGNSGARIGCGVIGFASS